MRISYPELFSIASEIEPVFKYFEIASSALNIVNGFKPFPGMYSYLEQKVGGEMTKNILLVSRYFLQNPNAFCQILQKAYLKKFPDASDEEKLEICRNFNVQDFYRWLSATTFLDEEEYSEFRDSFIVQSMQYYLKLNEMHALLDGDPTPQAVQRILDDLDIVAGILLHPKYHNIALDDELLDFYEKMLHDFKRIEEKMLEAADKIDSMYYSAKVHSQIYDAFPSIRDFFRFMELSVSEIIERR